MARGKRRAPIQPEVVLPEDPDVVSSANQNYDIKDTDEVDDFLAQRHKILLEKDDDASSDDDDVRNGERDVQVFNIDMSDSDESEDDSNSEQSDEAADEHDEKKDWGGRRNVWYGGDTHEYEIMDDDERKDALKDEEEEALRLQKKSLAALRPEDFRDDGDDDDDDDTDAGDDAEDEDVDRADSPELDTEAAEKVIHVAAPEIPLLVKEGAESRKQALIWKERVHWGELARLRYHLFSCLVNNVAYYLLLRTDPDLEQVEIRSHPVMLQIGRVRKLLKDAMALPCEEPIAAKNDAKSKDLHAGENDSLRPTGKDIPTEPNGHAEGDRAEDTQEKRKKKRKSKKRKKAEKSIEDDEKHVESLFVSSQQASESESIEDRKARKRRKLNQIVGAMESERKNKEGLRLASADADTIRKEPAPSKQVSEVEAPPVGGDNTELDLADMDDDDAVMERMVSKNAKKKARLARKAAAEMKPHVYTFNDEVEPDARRKASTQVVKNRGLTRFRPKDKKTPRTKNRLAYQKAVVRRKSVVTEYAGKPGISYGGEAGGINMSARKGSKLAHV